MKLQSSPKVYIPALEVIDPDRDEIAYVGGNPVFPPVYIEDMDPLYKFGSYVETLTIGEYILHGLIPLSRTGNVTKCNIRYFTQG